MKILNERTGSASIIFNYRVVHLKENQVGVKQYICIDLAMNLQ